MLQRIQSVYLVLAALAIILMFFFPLATYYNELSGNYKFFIYGVTCMDPEPGVRFSPLFTLPLTGLALFSSILTVTTLFLYKKRVLQIRLCAINLLVILLMIVVIFFFYASRITAMTGIEPAYNYAGMVMPLAALVFLILSHRSIKRDESLVKSSERLR